MWKIIKEFDEYLINDSGVNEKSIWSAKGIKWMKPRPLPNGYITICFTKNGKHYYRYLHRLLAEAFIPNTDNKPTVNHINHNRSDNRLENLEWATMPEQMDEITKENLSKSRKGQRNSPSTEFKTGDTPWIKGKHHTEETKKKIAKTKIKQVFQYTLDGELVAVYERASDAEEYGFSKDCIVKCCQGKHKQHLGFKWSYDKK